VNHKFSRKNDAIRISDKQGKHVIWEGMPDNCEIIKQLQIQDRAIHVVLINSDEKMGSFQNLIAIDNSGHILWKAELPDPLTGDMYVDISLQNNRLIAYSWSGYRVEIDLTSGQIISRKFTK